MTRTILLLLALFSFVSLSCNKGTDTEKEEGAIRLKKVSHSYESPASKHTGYRLFHYDSLGTLFLVERFIAIDDLNNNTRTETNGQTFLEYNTNGTLQKSIHIINNKPAFYFSYQYNNNGQISRMVHTLLEPGYHVQDRAFAYDAQGRLVADTGLASPAYIFHYNTYHYDAVGNIVTYGGGSRPSAEEDVIPYGEGYCKFDDKRNPFSLLGSRYHVLFELITGSLFNRNNPIESRSVNSSFIDTYRNIYLPNGLLKEYIRQSSPGILIKESFEYEER